MQKSQKPVPERYHTVTPSIVIDGAAKAIEFYRKAFGADELSRMPAPGGKLMHAEIKIGNSVVMLSDAFPEWGGCSPPSVKQGSPVTLHIYVNDADAFFAKATAAGAKVKSPLMDAFWGDRYGQLTDPFGQVWGVATHQYDYTPEEMQKGFDEMMAQMGHTVSSKH